MNAIKCAQCGHDNDLTRVFCQNCGTRLERPAGLETPTISGPTQVPAGQPLEKVGPVSGPKKIVRKPAGRPAPGKPASSSAKPKMTFGGALFWLVRRVITTAILAFVLAVLIQVFRMPPDLPPAQKINPVTASQLLQSLQMFASSPYPRSIDINQDQINNFLLSRIVPASSSGILRPEFIRTCVLLRDGSADFYVEEKYLGLPIDFYLTVVPVVENGATSFRIVSGTAGHLPIPSLLLPAFADRIFKPIMVSLTDASALVQASNRTLFLPGVLRLSWPGKPGSP